MLANQRLSCYTSNTRRWRCWLAVVALLWLGLCPPTLAAPSDTPEPSLRIVDDRGRSVLLPLHRKRLITLSPALSETVCALEGCQRLVGVDRYSNWPPELAAKPQLGGLDDLPLERIVSLKPDLVLAAGSIRSLDRLESLGITVVALEAKEGQAFERVIRNVAKILGKPTAADRLIADIDRRFEVARLHIPPQFRQQRVYVEVASSPFAAGEASFIGGVLTRLGLANSVPASLGPFPKINPEWVVKNQPDWIIAPAATLAEMDRRPGWHRLTALKRRQTCGLTPPQWDSLVRAGPRLVEAAEAIAACLSHHVAAT